MNLKYPILLIHGMGFRDYKYKNYWGRIPAYLESHGVKIFYGMQDCNGSLLSNCRQLSTRIDQIFQEHHLEKVNIIAHSKGGLEARYLISSMGYADKVASLTTISTPHHGSVTVDHLMKFPDGLIRAGCKIVDLWFCILGDKDPHTYEAICLFRTKDAEEFNQNNPDREGIYYQSFSFITKSVLGDLFLGIPYLVVKHWEGDNDGLLAPRASVWSGYRGIYSGSGIGGISHCDEVDMFHRSFGKKSDLRSAGEKYENVNRITDIREFYLSIVKELEARGL
ncbi:MAG: esterase/lipase family protein [Lachnospiraceae bacterium]